MKDPGVPHPEPGPSCIEVERIPVLAARGGLCDHLATGRGFGLASPPGEKAALATSWWQIMRLKRLFRRGWLRVGIPEELCESVAEHCTGVAMLCLLHGKDAGIDSHKAALMALAHELGEIHTGDLTPHDKVPKPEKHRREEAAIDQVLSGLDPETALPMRKLWEEYEAQESREARFVKEMDYLEMGSQAAIYMAEGYPDALELLESARRGLDASPFGAYLEGKGFS